MVGEILSGVGGIVGNAVNAGANIYDVTQKARIQREALKEQKAAREATEKAKAAANTQLSQWQTDATRILNDAFKNNPKLSSEDDLEAYRKMSSEYDPDAYVYEPEKFDASKYNVEDYLTDNKDRILDEVARTAQHTAAGSALGHSSGAIDAMLKDVASKTTELEDAAYNRMKDERQFDYGMYNDYINQQQKKLDALNTGRLNKMNILKDDITFDQENMDNLVSNKLSLGNSVAQARTNLI